MGGSGLACGRQGWSSAHSVCCPRTVSLGAQRPGRPSTSPAPLTRTPRCGHTGALAPGQVRGRGARPLGGVPGSLRPPAGGLPSEDSCRPGRKAWGCSRTPKPRPSLSLPCFPPRVLEDDLSAVGVADCLAGSGLRWVYHELCRRILLHLVQLALFPSFSTAGTRPQEPRITRECRQSHNSSLAHSGAGGVLSLTSHGCQSLTGEWRDKGGS